MMLRLIQPNGLLGLKQSWPGGNPDGFQGRGDGEADCLIRTAWIRDEKIRFQRIQTAGNALDRRIIAFEVDADIGTVHG